MPKETEPIVPGSGEETASQAVKSDDVTVTTGLGATAEAKPDMGATQLLGDADSSALANVLRHGKKYEIGQVVARGGMGAILDAKETAIERTVAMKIVLDVNSPDALARFVTEGKVTGQLEHPNIVPVHELGVDEQQQVFYTMKFVRGDTLRKVLQQLAEGDAETIKKYPLSHLLTIFQKVCDAMAFAHSKGVIHRDLKPENIMLGDFGEVLVMDWGLAKVLGMRSTECGMRNEKPAAALPKSASGYEATMAGTIMGTPQYMPPEQAHGRIEQLDARSDIYSLGAILYHILTLRPSVTGDDAMQILFKVCNGEIVAPAESSKLKAQSSNLPHLPGGRVPESLSAVVMKAMALRQEDRYQSVPELQREIEAYQNGFATSAEHASLLRQLVLLIKRHKAVFGTAFAAGLLIVALTVWFIANVTHERNIASRERDRATANEQKAVEEKENTRQALAKAQIALAEGAYREGDAWAMQAALNAVPEDLHDSNWDYLLEKSDTSIATIHLKDGSSRQADAIPHPKQPGVFAVVSNEGHVEFVEVKTGVRLLEFDAGLKKEKAIVPRLAFSPDGEQLAITSWNVGVVIHSARDGKKLAEWDGPLGDTCQFSPDGRQLLEFGNTRPVNLHDATTGRLLWAATRIGPAVFNPSGQFILVAFDGKVRLLNPKDGSELRELADVRSFASSLAIRPDGNRALIGQRNGFVRCVDLKDGRVLFETRAGTSAVHSVAYTPDGTRFVTWTFLSDKRLSLQVWDAESGAFLRSLLGGGINSTYGGRVRIHPISGELVASGRPWKVWDTGECPREKWLFTPTVARNIAFWKMDDWVFVCSGENGRICKMNLVDLQRKEPRDQPLWKPGPHSYRTVSVSADGRFAVVGGGVPSRVIRFLRLNGQKVEAVQTTQFERKNIPGLDIEGVALSPLGDRLWLNGVVLDPSTGAELLRRDRRGIASSSAACWLNNTQVVTADVARRARGQDGSEEQLVLWDATTGQRLRTVVNPSPIFTLAVAPDGKTVAEAGADKMVRLRDAATLEVLDEFRAHDDAITALAFHPNRPILATGSADLTIKLWDLDTGRKLDEFRGHTSAMESIAFSPSGRRLGSVSAYDRTTRIWEPESLNPDAATKIKADGWEDLLTKLKRNELAKNRNGWQLNNGVLASPNKKLATIALPGQFAQCSYQVRVKLRQLTPKSAIHVFLPVADRLTSFMLDGYPSEGHWSCLHQINGTKGKDQPGTVKGKVVKESELHELELTVRLEGSNVRFETRLDNQPLYQWAGSSNALGLEKAWQTTPPGALALGAHSADWLVYAVKVKRLEGKP